VSVAFIDANRHRWPVVVMCDVLSLAERTYYAAKKRMLCTRAMLDESLKVDIRRVWETIYRIYGANRVWPSLRREGHDVAPCTVELLMGRMNIRGVHRGRTPRTTIADTAAPRSPDLVNRRIRARRPDELWVTDITYFSTWEGWLYAAFVLDVYSRAIVGLQITTHLRTGLVLDAIEMAIWRRDTSHGLSCRSDAGCQFTSYRYTERLAAAGIAASIGSVGDPCDNATAEALNDTYKTELIRGAGLGRPDIKPSLQPSNGSTGTTRPASTARSATSHP
jgi:transposase InsO family protein